MDIILKTYSQILILTSWSNIDPKLRDISISLTLKWGIF